MANHTTRAQRINKRQDAIWETYQKQRAAAMPSKTPWVWNTYQTVNGQRGSESGFYITSPPGFDIAWLPINASMSGEIQGANATADRSRGQCT
jgi:hypothetical protein